jgi:hypothetical protein
MAKNTIPATGLPAAKKPIAHPRAINERQFISILLLSGTLAKYLTQRIE